MLLCFCATEKTLAGKGSGRKKKKSNSFWHKIVVHVENWFKIHFIFPAARKRAQKKLAEAGQKYRDNHGGRDFTV